MDSARFVSIDSGRIEEFAKDVPSHLDRTPVWNFDRQFSDRTRRTAQWVFVLDALNFSFWPDTEQQRWRVLWRGEMVKGYWALACSLKAAVEAGLPVTDAAFLENIDRSTLGGILDGEGPVPMLEERVAVLNELGHVLRREFDGEFANILEHGGGSANRVLNIVTECFSSFYDATILEEKPVYFFKRAQILISDIWGAFGATGLGSFADLSTLTAFADYKLPQLLRALGILNYSPHLAQLVDNLLELPTGSREEVEIRAATICAVEDIVSALANLRRRVDAFAIDWWLWELSHVDIYEKHPHHRTRTIFY